MAMVKGCDLLVEWLSVLTALPSLWPLIKVQEPVKVVQEQTIDFNEEVIGVQDIQIIGRIVTVKKVLVR